MPYLTDQQWTKVEQILPLRPPTPGRPPVSSRPVLEAMLHVILLNIAWMDLPKSYPPYATVFRRYNAWVKNGTWEQVLDTLYMDLFERTGYNIWPMWSAGKLLQLINGEGVLNISMELEQPENIYLILLFLRGQQHLRKEEMMRGIRS